MIQQMNHFLCFSSLNWTETVLGQTDHGLGLNLAINLSSLFSSEIAFSPFLLYNFFFFFIFFCSTNLTLSLIQIAFFQMAVLPIWYNGDVLHRYVHKGALELLDVLYCAAMREENRHYNDCIFPTSFCFLLQNLLLTYSNLTTSRDIVSVCNSCVPEVKFPFIYSIGEFIFLTIMLTLKDIPAVN